MSNDDAEHATWRETRDLMAVTKSSRVTTSRLTIFSSSGLRRSRRSTAGLEIDFYVSSRLSCSAPRWPTALGCTSAPWLLPLVSPAFAVRMKGASGSANKYFDVYASRVSDFPSYILFGHLGCSHHMRGITHRGFGQPRSP